MALYVLIVAERIVHQGWPGLGAPAGLSAMAGVWLCLLEQERLESVGSGKLRRAAARSLILMSIVLNGVLLVGSLRRGELVALLRLLSLACLLYGFRIFSFWPNG